MNKVIRKLALSTLMLSGLASASQLETDISKLYVSIFNRASEGEGNRYWMSMEKSLSTIANEMLDTDAAKEYFGDSLNSDQAFIEHIYKNTLNKSIEDDRSGIDYWTTQLSDKSRGEVVQSLIDAIETYSPKGSNYDPNDAKTVSAYQQFDNRVTVSDYMAMSVYKAPDDYKTSTSFNGDLIVTDDNSSVISSQKAIKSMMVKNDCTSIAIQDDSTYMDIPPSSNIEWSSEGDSVEDIANAFNNARAEDSTISNNLEMPSQDVWDSMSIQQKALYLLNKERYDRGIKPFEGIEQNVIKVAKDYADVLSKKKKFEDNEDGTPWERLDRVPVIKNNKDFFLYAENLYGKYDSQKYITNPIARAIYEWIYADADADDSPWKHRKLCLANGLNDNGGESGAEGLIGFATKSAYSKTYDVYATLVIMNIFDPSSSWDYSTTVTVPICSKK